MFSKNLYFNIIIRVILIVMLAALLGYLIVDHSLRLSIVCFLTIVFLTINLISYLNSTNKKIRFFFDSVRNDDSNISFPVESGNVSLNELYQSMNKVNL